MRHRELQVRRRLSCSLPIRRLRWPSRKTCTTRSFTPTSRV
jgi:hypothetical protein